MQKFEESRGDVGWRWGASSELVRCVGVSKVRNEPVLFNHCSMFIGLLLVKCVWQLQIMSICLAWLLKASSSNPHQGSAPITRWETTSPDPSVPTLPPN